MKDNNDEEKTLFQAIDAVDDKFLMETLKDMEKRKNLRFNQRYGHRSALDLSIICIGKRQISLVC